MLGQILSFIEGSWLGNSARSWTWLYPLANLGHVLGGALLVGGIAVFDALVLSRRYREAAAAGRAAVPLAALGIVMLALTGPVLFAAEATALGRNPVLQIKMVLMLIGFLNVCAYYFYRPWPPREQGGLPRAAPVHAAVSIAVWIGVLVAGRAIAYF
jgi:hypothetical protein